MPVILIVGSCRYSSSMSYYVFICRAAVYRVFMAAPPALVFGFVNRNLRCSGMFKGEDYDRNRPLRLIQGSNLGPVPIAGRS